MSKYFIHNDHLSIQPSQPNAAKTRTRTRTESGKCTTKSEKDCIVKFAHNTSAMRLSYSSIKLGKYDMN